MTEQTMAMQAIKQWNDDLCDDQALNFLGERVNTDDPVDLMKALASNQEQAINQVATGIKARKTVERYFKLEGCTDDARRKPCVIGSQTKTAINIKVIAELQKYIPGGPAAGFELYELVYDEDGTFAGVKKRFPE